MSVRAMKDEIARVSAAAVERAKAPIDPTVRELAGSIAPALGLSVESVVASVEAGRRARVEKLLRANASFAASLDRISDAAIAKIDERERGGWKIEATYTDRRSGNVAVMMTKAAVFDAAKGRVRPKLAMVYPDGTSSETFERSISVRSSY